MRWFSSRIAKGLPEGLSSLVQPAKARARGYRPAHNLIGILYPVNGRLPLRLPTSTTPPDAEGASMASWSLREG